MEVSAPEVVAVEEEELLPQLVSVVMGVFMVEVEEEIDMEARELLGLLLLLIMGAQLQKHLGLYQRTGTILIIV